MSRKYWGPFCPVRQDHTDYFHVIYPTNAGIVSTDDGGERPLSDAELDEQTDKMLQGRLYHQALRRAMRRTRS